MSKKTQLTPEEITSFLQKQLTGQTDNIHQLVEGEESQAFSYERAKKEYVIRINKSIIGFQKDAYAYNHFHSEKIPIPEVINVGYIDTQHAFCLTEKMPGITLQDIDSQILKQSLQPTTDSRERLLCYQLYIGLAEVYDALLHGNRKMAQWALRRSLEILNTSL